jgi:hypothetical protein
MRDALRKGTMRRLRSFGLAALAISCGAATLPAAATAGGGTTLAAAPLMAVGTTYSGDTASEPVVGHDFQSDASCTKDEQLWQVELAAGDKVLLRGVTSAPASGFAVEAIPPGTTEAQLLGTSPITGVEHGSLSEGLSFAAPRGGRWLIVVGPGCGYGDGPYQFSASVTPPAFAPGLGGGGSIATAAALPPGVTVSGNTAVDGVIPADLHSDRACTRDEELWTLSLAAGDQVLLRGLTESPATGFDVEAIPPGVTEPQLFGTSPIVGVESGSLSEGLSFAASRSGTWLIVVGPACGYGDGPYQLSATVQPPAFLAGPGGGATIAGAPLLTPGVTVSGNTAADAVINNDLHSDRACTRDEELWQLRLLRGDKVALGGHTEPPASGFNVEAMPPGVTEPQLLGVAPIAGIESRSLTESLSFTATASGTWLVVVGPACGYGDGPYQLSTSLVPILPRISGVHLGTGRLVSGHKIPLRLTLSEAATVSATLLRISRGRLVRGHCVASRRHGKRCELLHPRMTLRFAVTHGVHTIPLAPGRLSPGAYAITLTATDALGRTSKAVTVRLNVAAR